MLIEFEENALVEKDDCNCYVSDEIICKSEQEIAKYIIEHIDDEMICD